MAHFARLNSDNIVIEVLVVKNEVLLNDLNEEQESLGIEFLKSIFGQDTKWVQTSYNNNIRNKFAGLDEFYDEQNDVFYPQQPFDSWTLNTTSWDWEAPVAYPNDDNLYEWDEEDQTWNLIE
jgi:hypothetical protein